MRGQRKGEGGIHVTGSNSCGSKPPSDFTALRLLTRSLYSTIWFGTQGKDWQDVEVRMDEIVR